MSKLIWKPVLHNADIASLGRNSSFYFLEGEELCFLFIHEANEVSVMIVSIDEFGLTIYHVLEVVSEKFISCITGNSNFILMLDTSGDLFYLKGIIENNEIIFNFKNFVSFLSNDVILTWCRLTQVPNCLAMEGTPKGAGFIYHNNGCVYSSLCTTTDISKGLSELTTKRLNYFDCNKIYFMVKITGENAKLINNKILKDFFAEDEVLLIIEPNRLIFLKLKSEAQICSKPIPLDFQTESIISILNFNENGYILIICKSGKIICFKLKNVSRNFEIWHIFLGRKVYAISGYEDDGIKLFWSDHKCLYISTVSSNVESTKIQVIYKIGGALHLVYSSNHLIVITKNACIYETKTNLVKPKGATTLNSHYGLLQRVHKAANNLERLVEKIKVQECLIEALQIAKITDTSNNMCLSVSNDFITIQNNSNCVFLKKLWRVQIEVADSQKTHLEIRDLHTDILPNGNVNIEWISKNSFIIKLILFCDIFLPKSVIFIELKAENKLNDNFHEDKDLVNYSQYLADTYDFYA